MSSKNSKGVESGEGGGGSGGGGSGSGSVAEENTFKGKIRTIFGLSSASRQPESTTSPSGVDAGDRTERRPPQRIQLTLDQLKGEGGVSFH